MAATPQTHHNSGQLAHLSLLFQSLRLLTMRIPLSPLLPLVSSTEFIESILSVRVANAAGFEGFHCAFGRQRRWNSPFRSLRSCGIWSNLILGIMGYMQRRAELLSVLPYLRGAAFSCDSLQCRSFTSLLRHVV